jgi:hypothetical protein
MLQGALDRPPLVHLRQRRVWKPLGKSISALAELHIDRRYAFVCHGVQFKSHRSIFGRRGARYSAPVKFWRTRHDSNV